MKCFICNDLLKQPTTLPCGHNFCMGCITREWDKMIYEENYSCPRCFTTFETKPELTIYTQTLMVAELKVKFKKPEREFKQRRNSQGDLQENMCFHPRKSPQPYCIDDKKCIQEENLSEHRRHDIVPIDKEMRETEEKVDELIRKAKAETHERELNLQKISNNIEHVLSSAQSAVEVNERLFGEMISNLEKMKNDLNKTIHDQEKALVNQAQLEERQQRRAIMSLQATIADMESLSEIKEDSRYIKKSQTIIRQQEERDAVINHVSDNLSFEFVKIAIKHLKQTLEECGREAVESIQNTVRNVQVIKKKSKESSEEKQWTTLPSARVHRSFTDVSGPRPNIELHLKRRPEFLNYACSLTLDPDTAHRNLIISENNKKITVQTGKHPKKPSLSPQRFDRWEQVLCKEDLRGGRFYWEVDWSGMGAFIGVVRENFPRKGEGVECGLGRNPNSWCLQCSNTRYSVWHDDEITVIPFKVSSPRIGIYLDHKAGKLKFYAVSDQMTLLHRFSLEKCSGHLYPALGLGHGLQLQSIIKINKLENT